MVIPMRGRSRPLSSIPVRRVHVIFKTHLDVGFTDFARAVQRGYFERFIPAAIALAQQMRETTPHRFVWTTGSWIIYEYLEWAGPSNRRLMEQAIARGDVVWHALPFTSHSEFMGREMFRFGLSLSRTLDRRFGRRTIAAKMTDVPGHTRAIVPLLAEAGVRFLHIGVNPACKVPDVPPCFRWRDRASNTDIITMYHGNYGQAMRVPGSRDAIHFAHTGDNHGPQWMDEAVAALERLQQEYPRATVEASTLDAYARRLMADRPRVPVLSAEIGDSWIYGTASDPGKVAAYRAACRVRAQWLAAGRIRPGDPRIQKASRRLMMVAEHTWGMDIKSHLRDWTHYAPRQLAAVRQTPDFQRVEDSWREQRAYIDQSLDALGRHPLAGAMRREIDAAAPARPDTRGFEPVPRAASLDVGPLRLRLGANGAIAMLRDRATGRVLASASHPLALVTYEMFSAADYRRYLRTYARDLDRHRSWIVPDLSKPGMEAASGGHLRLHPSLVAVWRKIEGPATTLLARLAMPPRFCARYGAPRTWWLTLAATADAPTLAIDLQWFDKPATRLPEAIWCSFRPILNRPDGWRLDKLGREVRPDEVVSGGGRHLHAVESGLRCADGDGTLILDTLDAAWVAPGEPALLRCDNRPQPLAQGMHVNLYNNLFGTNFTAWYDADARFRFRLRWVAHTHLQSAVTWART